MADEKLNRQGLSLKNYEGSASTLCTGCGHDSISKHILSACFQNDLPPWKVVKVSGIGCSSKIPAYFMSSSFAFNSLHGRMAAVASGAYLARKDLHYLGVSGDGDSGNIGLGGFLHLIRRNVPMVYIIANNGVFGLTKGQFSAAANRGSLSKAGRPATLPALDFCALALEAGCGFVARTFSGDMKQVVPLMQAALSFKGTAVLEIISPCVTFNNHDGSTKSYAYLKEHDQVLQELGYYSQKDEIQLDCAEGELQRVELHDGSSLHLRKLRSNEHEVGNKESAFRLLRRAQENGETLTGLFYFNEERPTCDAVLETCEKPLNSLLESELKPSLEELLKLQKEYQ